jgi:hypothetical protein
MSIYAATGASDDLIRGAIRDLGMQAQECNKSPPAPDERGWGVPSWKDPAAYPEADELDDLEWRWEFLRRRHGFRLDWMRLQSEFVPATREQYFAVMYDLESPADPRIGIRELVRAVSTTARRGSDEVIRYPYSGLIPFRGALLSQTIGDSRFLDRIIPATPGPDDIFARFDIGRPMKAQLRNAEYYLQLLREEAYGKNIDARQRMALWPTYLRFLDAADAGASLGEMTKILPPRVDTAVFAARDIRTAAERLRRDWRH